MRSHPLFRGSLMSILIVQQMLLPLSFGNGLATAEAAERASARVEDDYDVEKYAEIARRASSEAADKRELHARAQVAEREARERRDGARERLRTTRQQLVTAQNDLQVARTEVPQLRERIAQLTTRARELETSVSRAQEEFEQKRTEAARLDARADELERKADAARKAGAPNAEELSRQAREARAAANAAAKGASQASNRLESVKQSLQTARTELSQTQARLERREDEIQRLSQQVIPSLQRQEGEQVRALDAAEDIWVARDREADQALHAFELARDRAESAARRLAEVRANLERAIAQARQEGTLEGNREGSRDGAIEGRNAGTREGIENGDREGRRDGMAQGMERARREGAREGQAAGWSLGSSTGSRDGEREGRSEGSENGRKEGLQAGYRDGLADGERTGYSKGLDQGHADHGYESGLTAGRTNGEARAQEDARRQGIPEGYAQAERELRAGPLAEASVAGPLFHETWSNQWRGIESLEREGDSGSSNVTFVAEGSPSSGRSADRIAYPHPAIEEAYQRAYETSYREARQDSYQREYREAYQPAYDAHYRREFAEWASKSYPNEYREAYEQASAAAYAEAYRREYRESYDRSYRPAYDSAYGAAYPLRRKEGYDRGYAEGFQRGRKEAFDTDYARGFEEGDRTAYEAAYPIALERAREEGRESARTYYASHAVLEAHEVRLTDRNGDGVFAPGEPLDLRAVISNYGNVAATNGSAIAVEFAPLTEGFESVSLTEAGPTLAARTRTTLLSLGAGTALKLKPAAAVGSLQRLRVRLLQQGNVVSERMLEVRVGNALEVVDLRFAAPLSDETWNTGSLLIRNSGSRPTTRPVRIRISSSEPALQVDPTDVEVPALAAGESREVALRLRFPASVAFRRVSLDISLAGGSWQSGRSVLEFDTTRRWTHNPSSEGLFVVTTREEGLALEHAARAAGRPFDIWNILAEGPLTVEAAKLYRNRLLVVADARTVIQAETRDSILSAFGNGTSVLNLGVTRAIPRFGRGDTLAEAIADRAEAMPLDHAIEGLVVRESNPFATSGLLRWMDRTGETGGSGELARSLQLAVAINRPFDEQLARASSPGEESSESTAALKAVTHSIVMEMRGVDAVNGNQFSTKAAGRDDLKVIRYVGAVVGATEGKGLQRLLAAYPDLDLARKDLGGWLDRQRLQLKKILKPVSKRFRGN